MPLVDELPYQPWRQRGHIVGGDFKWRLGVRPLDLDEWIEWGSDGAGWVAEKPAIMRDHGPIAFALLDDVDAECREAADEIAAHVDADLDPSLHPLDAAARLVPEDLVIMTERNGRLVFAAGSVCFPNRWDLRSKIGLTMAEVHAPVARLNDQLESAIDNFFDRLTAEQSYWRLGWGLIDSPLGYEPPLPVTPAIEIGVRSGQSQRRVVTADADDVFIRVERETLRRLPATNCVLFTIRTYIAPITTVGTHDRELITHAVSAMSDDIRDYKDVELGVAQPTATAD